MHLDTVLKPSSSSSFSSSLGFCRGRGRGGTQAGSELRIVSSCTLRYFVTWLFLNFSGRAKAVWHTAGRRRPSDAGWQSQRDCGLQPKVARHELPWVNASNGFQPQRGCGDFVLGRDGFGRNRVAVGNVLRRLTQGSSCRATLGLGTESRWDSRRERGLQPASTCGGMSAVGKFCACRHAGGEAA